MPLSMENNMISVTECNTIMKTLLDKSGYKAEKAVIEKDSDRNCISENPKQDEVAERVSKSRVVITNSIRLLKLDERVQNMLIQDMLSAGHGRALLPIEDKEEQYALALRIVDEKLSVRETEKLVKGILNPKKKKEAVGFSESEELAYQNMQERMRQILGSKVSIHKKDKNKGRIEIEYYSSDELERLMELIDRLQK